MADKPATLCQLQKDKFLGGQVGFVDTFNWAVNAISNLKGGKNCSIDWTTPDRPVIDVDIPDTDGGGGGTPDVSAVYDVTETTSGSSSGILIDYLDARADKFIAFPSSSEVSAVYDVVAATSGSQSGISIQYVDARADTFIPFGGGGEVSFIGTDNTVTSASSQFRLSKAANSNIVITANGNTLTIGAYYT